MTTLYYDCFSGISGDMNLALMLDLGVDAAWLQAELVKLGLSDEFTLHIRRDAKCGIHGTRIDVQCSDHLPHRNLNDIESIIRSSNLSNAVQDTSMAIFKRLADAEAQVHNCSVESVHFHEVGATDAIVDIVGAALCRHALNVDQVLSSSVELGGGFVICEHGRLPVPAPATAVLLHGIPTRRGAVQHETTTPTGAAILATLVDRFTDTPALVTETTGYGIGHRNMEIPNVLRGHLGQHHPQPPPEDAVLLECTVDDMTAEALGYAMERLLDVGASDVNFIPATMKKSRPATIVSVLCAPDRETTLKQVLFRETTTLGIKRIAVQKTLLERRTVRCDTRFGPVTLKEARLDGEVIRFKPEYEECAAIARHHDLPLAKVYAAIPSEPTS